VLIAAADDDGRSVTPLGSDDDATIETGSEADEEADASSAECFPVEVCSSSLALLDCREPVLVWAVTVVLSSASSVELVEVVEVEDDAELFSSELELGGGDSTVVCPSDAADDVELSAAEVSDPAASAADPAEFDPAEPGDDCCDAWPASSARATFTCGPVSDTANSAALAPAEAAPSCSHRRTPKLCDRRARCLPRPLAFPFAIF
jgi:hypothetical protein